MSPISEALDASLRERGCEAEVSTAGFPGACADTLLFLARRCSLPNMAWLASKRVSLKNLGKTLTSYRVPALDPMAAEDADVVVLLAGANDLNKGATGEETASRLLTLQRLYARRGAEVVLLSVGGASPERTPEWPEYEEGRTAANKRLFAERSAWVVDSDALLEGIGEEDWVEGWHLTEKGYKIVGDRLAAHIASHLDSSAFADAKVSWSSSDAKAAPTGRQHKYRNRRKWETSW